MIELKTIPHDTNFANVSITRIGDVRNTRYEISAGEAKRPTRINYQAIAEAMTQELVNSHKERNHGNNFEEER